MSDHDGHQVLRILEEIRQDQRSVMYIARNNDTILNGANGVVQQLKKIDHELDEHRSAEGHPVSLQSIHRLERNHQELVDGQRSLVRSVWLVGGILVAAFGSATVWILSVIAQVSK